MSKGRMLAAVATAWAALVLPAHAVACDEETRQCAPVTGAADAAVCTVENLVAYEGPLKETHHEVDDCLLRP